MRILVLQEKRWIVHTKPCKIRETVHCLASFSVYSNFFFFLHFFQVFIVFVLYGSLEFFSSGNEALEIV